MRVKAKEIIQFVMDYGKDYGYTFEHEATYDKMCLVNDAVYIARYASAENYEDTLHDKMNKIINNTGIDSSFQRLRKQKLILGI